MKKKNITYVHNIILLIKEIYEKSATSCQFNYSSYSKYLKLVKLIINWVSNIFFFISISLMSHE